MLKYINYQLHEDAERQAQVEQQAAAKINSIFTANMAAFQQFIPSVVDIVQQHSIQQYSVFSTKDAMLNIVDFATGRVVYGSDPIQEVAEEVANFVTNAPYVDLYHSDAGAADWPAEPLPAQINTLVVFGMGFGYQLNELLQQVRLRYLIVYEPSVDMLFCSLQANDWLALFETAAALNTQIFLQLGNDGSSLTTDLAELCQATEQDRVYLYRHYFHPVMDKVIDYAMTHQGESSKLLAESAHIGRYEHLYDFVSERNPGVLGTCQPQSFSNDERYQRNMGALKKFYPKVHQAIQKHQAEHWQLVAEHGQPNLYHTKRKALFYRDLEQDSESLVDYFVHHPYKDDVILGQRITRKLKHYLHFRYMQQVQPILSKTLQKNSQLAEHIDSLIVFGVALGKHLEQLTEQHRIKHLYICEPNLDFFAASLHVTDWAGIFERADEEKRRIYLNLGGDGSRYFYDLMMQFYQVGAYSIANTYMLSSYYNEGMQKAIYDLRAELKVVLAIGEYFDHARYGLAHTYFSLKNGHRFFKKDRKQLTQHDFLTLPVFVVGNGPSLDSTFEHLKAYQDQAIIISCGTALKALHSHGIQPDFHAEIEQNRATFDWVSQVKDPEYLKGIRLLSINGIHPDTAALFADTYLCLKEGETSTIVFERALTNEGIRIESLSYAYPTVTNLVVNTLLKLGARLLYLFGVDLGYVDVNYHHSKSSAYYKHDGAQIYDYQRVHGGGLATRGNFRAQVFTKTEFDVSRKLLEQAIKAQKGRVEVYNCSDGARIDGAVPLQPENILLPANLADKTTSIESFFAEACYPTLTGLADTVQQSFDAAAFVTKVNAWLELLEPEITSTTEALGMIDAQWLFLRECGKEPNNLLYLMMLGSTNYISAVLTKLAVSIDADPAEYGKAFAEVLAIWKAYLQEAADSYQSEPLQMDGVSVSYLMNKHQSTPV
ncbi:6-hydroxymethylpterin diphosphokinase MptE-like protein [Alkalimonas sp.]|uniref:motility associated factor glycosyltransferase family protein n=1 Tax=Alkalimonas sp. TaxID=1872453 RepID=UPI00263B247D|nr:6-hydroxymethylpterin diphosphokinase MptE-like protein [Alkalimonas sp.]MCC5824972.1 motility associated factor glycosyltransferase family protein [Alkalimonas sp.]